jgi:hypothetical protein
MRANRIAEITVTQTMAERVSRRFAAFVPAVAGLASRGCGKAAPI